MTAVFRDQALGHLDALYGFALRLSKRPAVADDLVQETYLRAFRFAHRFEPGTHLKAWLFQILRNTFLTFYRREAHRELLSDHEAGEELEDEGKSPDTPEDVATAVDLERALGQLSEEFRSTLILSDVEGFPLGEIATIMDIPVGTVKSRIFRARRLLRRQLADYRPQ